MPAEAPCSGELLKDGLLVCLRLELDQDAFRPIIASARRKGASESRLLERRTRIVRFELVRVVPVLLERLA